MSDETEEKIWWMKQRNLSYLSGRCCRENRRRCPSGRGERCWAELSLRHSQRFLSEGRVERFRLFVETGEMCGAKLWAWEPSEWVCLSRWLDSDWFYMPQMPGVCARYLFLSTNPLASFGRVWEEHCHWYQLPRSYAPVHHQCHQPGWQPWSSSLCHGHTCQAGASGAREQRV